MRFFADSKKTATHSAAGFSPTLPPSFPQLLWTFRSWIMRGQVTRSGQVTPLQNITITPQPTATMFVEKILKKLLKYDKVIAHRYLQNVYLGFSISVTSSQAIFVTSPIYVNGQTLNSLFYATFGAYTSGITSCKVSIDTQVKFFVADPLTSSEVTRDNKHFFC